MWSATIVIGQEGAQRSAALRRRGIGDGIRPFPQERLDKSLRFPIRPRRVGACPSMADIQGVAGHAKRPRPVATPVVTQDPTHTNASGPEPRDRPCQKRGARGAELVRQDLDIRDPAVIIHGDVHVLPADSAARATAIAMDAMADTADAPQRLDIDMNHVARRRPFIALNRHGRRAGPAIQAQPAQPGTHRRPREAQRPANRPRRQPMLLAQPLDQGDRPRRRLMAGGTRSGRGVFEPRDARRSEALHPLGDRSDAHARTLGGRWIAPALEQDTADEQKSRRRRTLRITMELHPGPPLNWTAVW